MSLSFKPIGERVIIKNIEIEKKTASGIILYTKEKNVESNVKMGEIVSLGIGYDVEQLLDNNIQIGDKVYFDDEDSYKIEEDGNIYSIVCVCDIIAKIN